MRLIIMINLIIQLKKTNNNNKKKTIDLSKEISACL
jgi:hypothetical protein